ncbi:MAG TPA: acyltransferase [Candidatus Sulfotelmatobacter sp.]|jgi:acetyltransferase-like isoleucine patch superfamily enzyme|nr:acyltransferase [Candidatus Sulfotelmatobacter sp.]
MTIDESQLARWFEKFTSFRRNEFHPMVWIVGDPTIGRGVSIGGFSEVNGKDAELIIGDGCDIAAFVSINCADSHRRCIGLSDDIRRRNIRIGDCVFIGSHSVVKGGAVIGHHSVVAAGTVVEPGEIPPYSLVSGNPMTVRAGYYENRCVERADDSIPDEREKS